MTEDMVTLKDICDMTTLTRETVYVYKSTGRLPAPDGMVGYTPVWRRSTIEDWETNRRKR